MALNKQALKDGIKAAAVAAMQEPNPDNRDAVLTAWANKIGNEISDAIVAGIDGTTVNFTLSTSSGPVSGTITLSANVT